jgi:putative OPT family oligopeptide transporter
MSQNNFKPFISAESNIKELTIRSLSIGIFFALVMGAANAYIGMKAGMTIAATFPAAVIAIALLRSFKGTVLEENIVRSSATVGEALVGGAIFTLPALIISGVWNEFNYWTSSFIMLIGGLLGIMFIILLRKTLIEESDLPYPESLACYEIVKAGQKGDSGAKYVFSAIGLSMIIEFFKNNRGLQIFGENTSGFFQFGTSSIKIGGIEHQYQGGLFLQSPIASPALMSVGYIIGPELSAISWAGGLFAWLFLIPLIAFINYDLNLASNYEAIFHDIWYNQVRMIAIGAMVVGAANTLWKLRSSLSIGLIRAFKDIKKIGGAENISRISKDIPVSIALAGIILFVIPIVIIYYIFTQDLIASIILAIVMIVCGFLFSAVAGYLVGIMGTSNNPTSGLTLPSLLIAAVLVALFGITGNGGVAAALLVAAIVCCALAVSGSLLQDLKAGHYLGGTPWKMELSYIVTTLIMAFVLIVPIHILHIGTPGGIGGPNLPAPQAGLMSALAQGIIGGKMAWPLLLFGAALAVGLILVKAPSPTLIAVGMYLPFETTSAIFVGGIIKLIVDKLAQRKYKEKSQLEKVENTGILLASGLVAGEALTGVILAALFVINIELPFISDSSLLGLLIFVVVFYVLIRIPLKRII